jgi:hypothetical protein
MNKYICKVCGGSGYIKFEYMRIYDEAIHPIVMECGCENGYVDWIKNIVENTRREDEDNIKKQHDLKLSRITPISEEEYKANWDIALENREKDY